MRITPLQSGFSAVELLITLFIGFLFVLMGYQLYAVSTQGSEESREIGKASNLAYEELRKIQLTKTPSTGACSTNRQVLDSKTVDNDTAQMTTYYSCPYADSPTIRLVTVTVTYNLSERSVTHAMYITQTI